MTVAIAVLGKRNSLEYFACLHPEFDLQFRYKMHKALDFIEENLSSAGKPTNDVRELYLGQLYAAEDYKLCFERCIMHMLMLPVVLFMYPEARLIRQNLTKLSMVWCRSRLKVERWSQTSHGYYAFVIRGYKKYCIRVQSIAQRLIGS